MKEESKNISVSKSKFHACPTAKLNEPQTDPQIFPTILRTFLNGTKIQKIPSFLESNELINNFRLKANQFNQQYTTGDNQSSITETMRFETEKRLSTFRR